VARFFVPDADDQEALLNQRRLLSPGGAAHVLGISRQAVHAASERPGGRLLHWMFGNDRQKRIGETYIDFGWRDHIARANPRPEEALQWIGSNAADLLAEARERHRLELAGARQEPLL
jgi:hypothetical protein